MRKSIIVIISVITITLAGMIATMVGLSNGVGELAVEMNRNQVDAVLASAKVEDESSVSVPVLYYAQAADECVDLYNPALKAALEARQFEWNACGYYQKTLEKEMTEPKLNAEYLPVAKGGSLTPNRGVTGENFTRWFSAVAGKSEARPSTIELRYDSSTTTFSYENDNFYPTGNGQLFTMDLGLPVEVTGEGKESFSIAADDDTWVYVNDKIVLDMGGIHDSVTGRFKINEDGEIYTAVADESLAYAGVKLNVGETAIVRIFHANRNSGESVMRMSLSNMLVKVANATLASTSTSANDDGVTVAYDPSDPTYVAPLGESVTYTPDRSRVILNSVVTMASILGALTVVVMVAISVGWRYWRRHRNLE